MNLELAAMRWLWLEKNCHYVLEQRSPRYMMGQPDVVGVTKARYLVEIEIKRSVSDFRADFSKRHRMPETRSFYIKEQPRQFYYLVPMALKDKVESLVPEWAGLMIMNENGDSIEVVKPAPVNTESRKLSCKECVKLARMMVAHMFGYAQACRTHHSRFMDRDDQNFIQWEKPEVGLWQI